MRSRLLVVALGLSAPLASQSVPTTTLDRPEARFPEPLSLIAGFRAFDANRALVADPLEGRLALLDWTAGTLTNIGRTGGGPGEFGAPGPLFARGSETLMLDMGNRRLLRIVNGRIDRTSIPLGGADDLPMFPRAVDADGRVYFDLAGITSPQTVHLVREGRAPILRLDPASGRVDTIGMLTFPPQLVAARAGEVRAQIGNNAYQPRDAWALAPDGRVAIVRTSPYRVEWLGSRPQTGPEVPYRPVPVGTAEREAWADQVANRGMAISVENGRRSTRRAPRPDVSRIEFPATMPPFANPPIVAANGDLWVERSRPAREAARTYDVFDGQGRRVRQVTFPGGQRVLVVGAGFVMTALVDDDGLEWVERFRT